MTIEGRDRYLVGKIKKKQRRVLPEGDVINPKGRRIITTDGDKFAKATVGEENTVLFEDGERKTPEGTIAVPIKMMQAGQIDGTRINRDPFRGVLRQTELVYRPDVTPTEPTVPRNPKPRQ